MNDKTHILRDLGTRSRNSFAPLRLCVSSSSGFTFVEILAALVFLAILVPAIVEGIGIASRVATSSERSAIACELAQNKLNELTVGDAWTSAETTGDFGADWPGYRWEETQSTWDMDSMTLLAVKVFYNVQGQEQSLSLSTLVNGSATSGTSTSTSTSASSSPAKK